MSQSDVRRVLVVGSCRKMKDSGAATEGDTSRQDFIRAAEEIGNELAKRGFCVMIGSEDENTFDFHVAQAMLQHKSVTEATDPRIEVYRAEDGRYPFCDQMNQQPRLFAVKQFPTQEFRIAHTLAAARADAVIVMGGMDKTPLVATTASLMRKAVIPVATFGGAAEDVWRTARQNHVRFFYNAITDVEADHLIDSWDSERSASTIVDITAKLLSANRDPGTEPRVAIWATLLLLCSMAIWIAAIGFGVGSLPGQASATPVAGDSTITEPIGEAASSSGSGWTLAALFTTALFAGLIGATTSTLNDIRQSKTITRNDLLVTCALGIGAASIAAMLFLMAEVTLADGLQIPETASKYSRSALFMSLAAVFSALYLEAAFLRFDRVRDSVVDTTRASA